MDQFADIRPYHDDEVVGVVQRLQKDAEFHNVLAKLAYPRLAKVAPKLLRPAVRWHLRRQLKTVKNVHDVQMVAADYLDDMIESRCSGVTVSGLENLPQEGGCLILSNHRDIALDPALINYSRYHHGLETVRIAIGDNLLSKPFAADLMRLNKSFIVPRSARAPKKMLVAFKKLSAYIKHSVQEDGETVWMAQREGRAKDGLDRTEPAIIKMITMNRNKAEESFADYIRAMRLMPATVSYEWDPCDVKKAEELLAVSTTGSYQKAEHEDLKSIGLGIEGEKGAIHVAYGTLFVGDYDTPEQVATALDEQIIDNYVLHPSNLCAYEKQTGEQCGLSWGKDEKTALPDGAMAAFDQRFVDLSDELREQVIAIYANPVHQKLKLAALDAR